MFYVDVMSGEYTFYYNMVALLNASVAQTVGNIIGNRPISNEAKQYVSVKGQLEKRGPSEFGVMGSYDQTTGDIEYLMAEGMAGITAVVSEEIAKRVLERAVFYCPKDTGYLADSGRIEILNEGQARIYFDCEYAWYVHEFTWKNHKFPTCAKFLTLAVQEIGGLLNGGNIIR